MSRIAFIASGRAGNIDPRYRRIYETIRSGWPGEQEVSLYSKGVDPMSPTSTRHAILQLVETMKGEDVLVNITGGTKPMALGAYAAAQELHLPALYVDSHAKRLRVFRAEQEDVRSFNLEAVSVKDYLSVHGRCEDERKALSNPFSEAELAIGSWIFKKRPGSFQQVNMLRGCLPVEKQRAGKSVPLELRYGMDKACRDLLNQFKRQNWLVEPAYQIIRPAVTFLEGGWLEAYVFKALQSADVFDDVVGRMHIRGVTNELDVACTLQARLAILECKAGARDDAQVSLNRLHALRDTLAGTFGVAFYVQGLNRRGLAEEIHARAEAYGITVVGYDNLEHIARIVSRSLQ